jgi:hypothetical protein
MSTIVDDVRPVIRPVIHWPAILGGALAAAALATVLHTFAAAIGLGVSSTAPTWRDSSTALWILSGLYLVLVALASYGLGGYVAGWIRSWSDAVDRDDADTTNGIHGLLVWALATLIMAVVVAFAALAAASLATPSTTSSAGNEKVIAYDIDRLFRGDGRYPATDTARARGEAGRILLTSSGHSGVNSDDRAYLSRLVVAQTGLPPVDAERRVDATIVRARENINRARRSGVLLAFAVGAATLLGAAAAWFAAGAGANHGRDPKVPSIWSKRSVTTFP